MALVRGLMPPLLSRLHGSDRGTARGARLSHSQAKSPANVTMGCYNQATNTIVAIIKREECESSYSDGGASIAEPPTSAMEQVLLS